MDQLSTLVVSDNMDITDVDNMQRLQLPSQPSATGRSATATRYRAAQQSDDEFEQEDEEGRQGAHFMILPNLRVRDPPTRRLAADEVPTRLTRADRTKNPARMEPGIAAVSTVAIYPRLGPGRVRYISTAPDSSATVGPRPAAVEGTWGRTTTTTATANSNSWRFCAYRMKGLECRHTVTTSPRLTQWLETADRWTQKDDSTRSDRPTPDSPHYTKFKLSQAIRS